MDIKPDDAAAQLQAAVNAARSEAAIAEPAPVQPRRLRRIAKLALPVVAVAGLVGVGAAKFAGTPPKARTGVTLGAVSDQPALKDGVPALASADASPEGGEPRRNVRVVTQSPWVQPQEQAQPRELSPPAPPVEAAGPAEPPPGSAAEAAPRPAPPPARKEREARRDQQASAPPPAPAASTPLPPAKPRRTEPVRQASAPDTARPPVQATPQAAPEESRILGVPVPGFVPSGREIKDTLAGWGEAVLSIAD